MCPRECMRSSNAASSGHRPKWNSECGSARPAAAGIRGRTGKARRMESRKTRAACKTSPLSPDPASMSRPSSFDYPQLLECGHGKMFGPGNARLPLPPMLMFDRITEISTEGGRNGKGVIRAELDITSGPLVLRLPFRGRSGDARLPGRGCDVAAGGLLPAVARRTRPWSRARRRPGEIQRPGRCPTRSSSATRSTSAASCAASSRW